MRGRFTDQRGLFSLIFSQSGSRRGIPWGAIRCLVRDVLAEMSLSLSALYAREGRPSIPSEQLLSARLLQAFYGIRSERQFMERLDYISRIVGLSALRPPIGSWTRRPSPERRLSAIWRCLRRSWPGS